MRNKREKEEKVKGSVRHPPKGTGLAIFFENRTAASDLYFVTIKCRVVAPRFSLKVFRLIRSHLPDRKETPVLITFCTAGFKSSASLVNVGFFLCLVRVSKKKKPKFTTLHIHVHTVYLYLMDTHNAHK